MSKRKKAVKTYINHNDPLSYLDRYQHSGKQSESVETYWVHLDANGKPWCLGNSKEPPTRENLIATRVGMLNEIHFADGTFLAFRESEEYATQQVDLLAGIWPPKRILCVATEGQLRTLEAKFGTLPDRYYEPTELPIAA